jgi:hypothetical protein
VRILGLLLLILGIVGGFRACITPPPAFASHSYMMGQRLGRITGMILFIGGGLWLMRRGGGRTEARTRSPLSKPPAITGPPTSLPVRPQPIAVNVQCSCGQAYALEIQPVAGDMPDGFTCPACGADGTDAAKRMIAQANVARAKSPPWPVRGPAAWRRLHPAVVVGMAAVTVLVIVFTVSLAFRKRPWRSASAPPGAWTRPEPPRPQPGGRSTPGSRAEAAPVRAGVTAVEVFWGSSWWPATIMRREGERVLIHYDGWSSGSDEWVTPDRLRPRHPGARP